MSALSWGIAGTSKISHDFHSAIVADFTTFQHKVVAIGSRNKRRANLFAKEHNISQAYGSYEQLALNSEIEVIYVGSSAKLHYDICKIMINAEKHVLCEAPVGLDLRQVIELLLLAELKGVLLLTGFWSRFFPAYSYLGDLLAADKLGEVKDIYVKTGLKIEDSKKITDKSLAGGVIYSSVLTALQFIIYVYKELPKVIRTECKINKFGIDMYLEADLIFSNCKTATLVCSGIENIPSQANVIGRKGVLVFPQFESPTNVIFGTYKREYWPLFESKYPLFFKNTQGLRYEADEVWKCIRQGNIYCEKVPNEDVIKVIKIVDEIRKQLSLNM